MRYLYMLKPKPLKYDDLIVNKPPVPEGFEAIFESNELVPLEEYRGISGNPEEIAKHTISTYVSKSIIRSDRGDIINIKKDGTVVIKFSRFERGVKFMDLLNKAYQKL